ncbi:lipopolysaccharide biosynthesis protein [Salipaludibacillus sp. CF4.18]|uniref:lipopolysaccharide biosynthesis protein n=1 Tax=Salipaludibacillus sp. CF4.18 TaxID=3373081 RepID=UPI003EE72D60
MKVINSMKNIIKGIFLIKNKKEIVLSASSQIVLISQLVIQNKLLAVNFSKLEYGNWALLLSIYVFISMFPFTAFDQGIAKLTYNKINSHERYYFTNNIYIVYLILFFVYFIILGIATSTVFTNTILWTFFVYFILFTFTEILKNSLVVMDNASRNRFRVLLLRLFDLIFRALLLLYLGYLDYFTINNVLIIFTLGNTILILTSYKKFDTIFGYLKLNKIKHLYKEIFLFSYPLVIWAVFGWLHNMINRWYLDYYLNPETVAKFTILISLSYFLPSALYGIVNNFFMPYIFSKNTKTSYSFYKRYLMIVGFFLLLYTVIVAFTSDYLVVILADNKYLDISSYIPFVTLSSSIYIVAMLSTFEIYRSGNTKLLLLPSIISGLLPAIVGFFIINYYGFIGAIYNHILGQVVYAIIVLYISYRHIRGEDKSA